MNPEFVNFVGIAVVVLCQIGLFVAVVAVVGIVVKTCLDIQKYLYVGVRKRNAKKETK